MKVEKRKKTKMLQFRVTPDDYKVFDDKSKQLNKSKTELFTYFLEMLKKGKL